MCRKTRTRKTPLPLTREVCAMIDDLITACERYERKQPVATTGDTKAEVRDRAAWEVND